MSTCNSELTQAILNDDIILESPNALPAPSFKKLRRRIKSKPRKICDEQSFIKSLNLNEPVHDIKVILKNPPIHWLKLKDIVPDFEETNTRNLDFSKVHIYRTISEILYLENCIFRFVNIRIIGIYKYGKIPNNQNICHYIEERRTGKKIEIDLNLVNHFPIDNSTYLFFGSIKLKTFLLNGNCETVPYILVHFFQDLHDPESLEAIFHVQKKLNPIEFDSIVSLDLTYDQSMSDTVFETNEETLFDEFNTTMFISTIESDELLYYEIERLMNINID